MTPGGKQVEKLCFSVSTAILQKEQRGMQFTGGGGLHTVGAEEPDGGTRPLCCSSLGK